MRETTDADTAAFEEGFEQGYGAVMGNDISIPCPPLKWQLLVGRTAFQTGILAGIEAALGRKIVRR
jgi:hypothetical protein